MTKSDLKMRRIVVRYMVQHYRQAQTQCTLKNLQMFYAQRHHVTFDFSAKPPLPIFTA